MQLNSKLWCFDQFPASVSTCVVCQVEDTLAVFEKMPKDRNVLDFRAGSWIYPEGRIYILWVCFVGNIMIEQHLVCAWTMLLLLYIVTLSIDSPVSELV